MREQEAGLTLRSLYGSTRPLGDTVRCPDELKLAATLQDDARNFPLPRTRLRFPSIAPNQPKRQRQ